MSILVNPAKGMSSLQLSSSKHHTSRKVQQYDSGVELRSGSESKESVLRVYSVASSHKGQDTNDILLFKYLAAIRKLEQIDEIHHLRKKNRRKFMEMRYQLSNNLWPESDADIVVEDDLESYAETMVIPALTDFYLSNFEIIDHRTASSEVLDITNELETTQDKEVYISMSVKEKLEDDGMFLEDLDGMSLENLEVSDLDQELQSDSERRQEEVVALDTITKRDEDTDELSYFERTKNGDESTDSLKTAYDEKVQVNRYVKDQLKEESKCLESFQILPSYQEYQSEIEPVSSEATVAGDATADQAEYLSDFDTTKRSSENSKPLEGLEEKLKAAEREVKIPGVTPLIDRRKGGASGKDHFKIFGPKLNSNGSILPQKSYLVVERPLPIWSKNFQILYCTFFNKFQPKFAQKTCFHVRFPF